MVCPRESREIMWEGSATGRKIKIWRMIFRSMFLATYLFTYTFWECKKKCANEIPRLWSVSKFCKGLKAQLESIHYPNWLINLVYYINLMRMPTWLLWYSNMVAGGRNSHWIKKNLVLCVFEVPQWYGPWGKNSTSCLEAKEPFWFSLGIVHL